MKKKSATRKKTATKKAKIPSRTLAQEKAKIHAELRASGFKLPHGYAVSFTKKKAKKK